MTTPGKARGSVAGKLAAKGFPFELKGCFEDEWGQEDREHEVTAQWHI